MDHKRNDAIKYWMTAAVLIVFLAISLLSNLHYFKMNVFETPARTILFALQQLCLIACGVYMVLFTVVSLKEQTTRGMFSTIICIAVILALILVIRFVLITELMNIYTYLITSLCGCSTVLIVQYIRYRKINKEHKSTE